MASIFGDNSQEEELKKQEERAAAKEAQLAKQLAARRGMSSGTNTQTLFSQVEGQNAVTANKTKLGG